jgi:tetratricopeptide (TPR) repeat protein
MMQDTASMNADFRYSAKINPKNELTYIKRGAAKTFFANFSGAQYDLNLAITLNPKSAEAYLTRAKLKIAMADRDGACEDLNKALQLGSKEAPDLIKTTCY